MGGRVEEKLTLSEPDTKISFHFLTNLFLVLSCCWMEISYPSWLESDWELGAEAQLRRKSIYFSVDFLTFGCSWETRPIEGEWRTRTDGRSWQYNIKKPVCKQSRSSVYYVRIFFGIWDGLALLLIRQTFIHLKLLIFDLVHSRSTLYIVPPNLCFIHRGFLNSYLS